MKDPKGVVEAFKLARKQIDARLVLLGNFATDDPEGEEISIRSAPVGTNEY